MVPRPEGPEITDLVAALEAHFVGRTDRYMAQQDDGSYVSIKRKLTKAILTAHCKGQVTIASYTNNENGLTHVALLDIDSKEPAAKELVVFSLNWLKHFNIPCVLEPSGGKGYHTWVLFKCWVPAVKARALLQALVNDWNADHEGEIPPEKIEIFPKQITPATFDNPGFGVKMPWGFHRKGQKWTPIMSPDTKPLLDWGLSIVNDAPRVTEFDLDPILENYPEAVPKTTALVAPGGGEAPQKGYGLPCFAKMMEGTPPGTRHVACFRLAVQLYRQGISENRALAMLLQWDDLNTPPHGEKNIKVQVKSAYTGKYKLGCPDIEAVGFCDKNCPVYKKRSGERDDKVEAKGENPIEYIVKVCTRPPSYKVLIKGKEVSLTIEDLYFLHQFKKAVMANCDFIPSITSKQAEWESIVTDLLSLKKDEEAPEDAADEAEIMEAVYDYLKNSPKATTPSDVSSGRPIERDGYYCFRVRDVITFLKQKHRVTLRQSQLWNIIRGAGGASGAVRIEGSVFRLWRIPSILPAIKDFTDMVLDDEEGKEQAPKEKQKDAVKKTPRQENNDPLNF